MTREHKRTTMAPPRMKRCAFCGLNVHGTKGGRLRCAQRAVSIARALGVPPEVRAGLGSTDYLHRPGRAA